ncbi:hydrolase [Bacteroidia bacterium]|nr:hydrolase [Bacteroidia bacterium]
MKHIFFTVSLILCLISVSAQEKIKLWAGTDVTRKEKWSELTVFLPEKPDTSGISVIICPGGSYYWLDMDNEGYAVAKYLNSKGITAFVLKYRTAMRGNHHPAMIQDLQRAMQIVKENAEKYKIDPEKVGVMGFSAGGHLAGTAAEYFDLRFATSDLRQSQVENRISQIELKPYFAAMIYPVVTMTNEETVHKKSRKNLLGKNYSAELQKMMSLEQNVRPDMPPIFLLHCTGDKTVDYRNSVAMDKALTEKNVKHKFLLFEENGHGGHGFGIQPNGKATGWIDVFLEWLNEL